MKTMKKIASFICSCTVLFSALPRITASATDTLAENSYIKGDVDADGILTIADVITLQKWILAVPDIELNNWKAADLCEDDRIDVFDLCLMKRLLLSQPANSLIGMNYADAVENAYISKSEYNRHITGELKSSIEEKMGRPIDYSIDRFYPVKSGDYIYNSATMDIYPIIAETPVNCATWYWKGTKAALYELDDNMDKQNEFLDALEFYGITEIYYSMSPNNLVKKKDIVAPFVKNAYARDMKVYLLGGELDWLWEESYESSIYNAFNKIEEYNSLVDYDARIAGYSYDAEIWNNSDYNWKTDNSARCQQLEYYKTAQNYAESKNLSVNFCLPYWITRYYYTNENGTIRNMYDGITEIANDTILMVYRDTSPAILKLVNEVMNDADNTSLYYAKKNDCNLEIAAECNVSDEGNHVTFYEEMQEDPTCVKSVLSEVREELSERQDFTTYAIHHAVVLYEFYLSEEQN